MVSCFFPNGACRKISSVSLGLWDAEREAPLDVLSFVGVLKGASWKTSEVTGLSGALTGSKSRPVEAAGFLLLSSVGNMCALEAALLCRLSSVKCTDGPAARCALALSALCRSACGRDGGMSHKHEIIASNGPQRCKIRWFQKNLIALHVS